MTILRAVIVQKYPLAAATPFAGVGAFGGMGQEMLQCAEQEVAEPATLRVSPPQGAFFQQVDEEILGEVLGVVGAIAPSADEGVNRIGIKAIEFLQGSAGFPGAFSRRGGNQSPLGRMELGPPASRRVKWRAH